MENFKVFEWSIVENRHNSLQIAIFDLFNEVFLNSTFYQLLYKNQVKLVTLSVWFMVTRMGWILMKDQIVKIHQSWYLVYKENKITKLSFDMKWENFFQKIDLSRSDTFAKLQPTLMMIVCQLKIEMTHQNANNIYYHLLVKGVPQGKWCHFDKLGKFFWT